MKLIKSITIVSLLVFVFSYNEILKAQTDSDSLIKISCSLNWMDLGKMVSNVPDFPSSVASRGFFIDYENLSFDDDEVYVIREFRIIDNNGSHLYPCDAEISETELENQKGSIQTLWWCSDQHMEGIGEMTIYLTDLDNNIISNKIFIPAACGKKYLDEMFKIYGEPKY